MEHVTEHDQEAFIGLMKVRQSPSPIWSPSWPRWCRSALTTGFRSKAVVWEHNSHVGDAAGTEAFLLPPGKGQESMRRSVMPARLERAIGVIYRPETEAASHYFSASLPRQFDEYIWFDRTRAVQAPGPEVAAGVPETLPFGL